MSLPQKQETSKPESRPFVSPFSVSHNFSIKWTRIDERWNGISNILTHLTERDQMITETVAACRVVTGTQLAKAFWQTPSQAKERLRLLARHGVLVRHGLQKKGSLYPVYTVGPLGSRIMGEMFEAWWKDVGIEEVLRWLVLAQLFFRLRQKGNARALPAPIPFTGIIALDDKEYPVVVVRQSLPEMKWAIAKRLFVIAETEQDLLALAPQVRCPARYTTDERLFTKPLPELFLCYKNGTLEQERE